MKINTQTKNKKRTVIIASAVILLFALVSYAVFARTSGIWPFPTSSEETTEREVNDVNYSAPTDEEADAGLEAKKRSVEADAEVNNSSDPTSTPTGSSTSNKESVNVLISSLNQNENNDLDVRTSISTVETGGECTLTLTKAGAPTIRQQADTQVITGYSACSGFVVPVSQLSSGIWTAQLAYEGRTTIGSASSSVEISK